MDFEQIKQLMKEMENSKLSLIHIELADGTKISMEKPKEEKTSSAENVVFPQNEPIKQNKSVKQDDKKENEINKSEANYCTITSPMVGTFYTKASPSSEPFVKVGDRVKKGDVLCIIEAMKLMNEIESDVDGEIIEICQDEEALVEYGTVLFKIK